MSKRRTAPPQLWITCAQDCGELADSAWYRGGMPPVLTLERPDVVVAGMIGDDGLTESQRQAHAASFEVGIGRRALSAAELDAYERWRAER